jgi:hypothetical protein
MTGWKTVIFGAAVAVGPGLLNYLGAVNWQTIGVSPSAGAVIGAVIIGLRAVTSTAIGQSK